MGSSGNTLVVYLCRVESIPLDVLPELQELTYPGSGNAESLKDVLTSFIDARRNAGRPVTLTKS